MADKQKVTGDRILAGDTLSFSYSRSVSQQIIKRIWEQVLQWFVDNAAVGAIEMPKIEAYVIAKEPFIKAQRQLLKSTAIRSDGALEYGVKDRKAVKTPDVSACFFREKSGWIIIKREHFGPSLEQDIAYGMAHICRQVLILPADSLISEHLDVMPSSKPSKSNDVKMAVESGRSGQIRPGEPLGREKGLAKYRKGDKIKIRRDCTSLFRGRVGTIQNEIDQDSHGRRYSVKFISQGFEATNSFAEGDIEPAAKP